MNPIFQSSHQGGFRIATAETPFLQSVALSVLLPVGSRHETEFPKGISHFTEHMIFKGTPNRTAEQIAQQVEGSGASMNAYTTEDHTLLEMRGPEGSEEHLLEIMADMVWNSSYEPSEIESECDVIEEEIIGYEEVPAEHIHDLLSTALWGEHPLGTSITGTTESIQAIDQSALQAFTQLFYRQNGGITVATGGSINHTDFSALVAKHCPTLDGKKQECTPVIDYRPTEIVEYRDIEQSHLSLGFKTCGRHNSDRHVIRLISLLLGETMSSRLFQKIREELGLCYSIHTDFTLFEDLGSFHISAALDSERFDYAREAIYKVLQDFLSHGVTEKELQMAKNYATSQTKIALEGSQSFMQWVSDSTFCYDTIIPPQQALQNTQNVSLEDIQRVAQEIFTLDNHAVAIISPE